MRSNILFKYHILGINYMKHIDYADSLAVLGGDVLCLSILAHHLIFF